MTELTQMINPEDNKFQKTEFDTQISTAKQYPRDVRSCVDEMKLMATMDPDTAESCYYVLKRKEKDIVGPSIRMAEIAINCWTNIHAATRIVDNDGIFVTAQGVVWDLERNIKIITEVKRSIRYANGGIYSSDMQVITANAACSIALRNAAFKVIPKAYIDILYKECRRAAVGVGNAFISKRNQVFKRFNELGIETTKILGFFGEDRIEDFDEDQLADLIGVGTAIKEGLLEPREAFTMDDDMRQMDLKSRLESIMNNKRKLELVK